MTLDTTPCTCAFVGARRVTRTLNPMNSEAMMDESWDNRDQELNRKYMNMPRGGGRIEEGRTEEE